MTFDIRQIGKNIAGLRRTQNMTQMQLADEVGVSFQAVSNWERGNSMPDISKLPQLAELFSVSLDELLGCNAPLVEKAAEGKLAEHLRTLEENGIYITAREASEVAPILPPKQMDIIIEQVMNRVTAAEADDNGVDEFDFQDESVKMRDLLPFMSTDKVDYLMRQRSETGTDLHHYAPFANKETVDEVARQMDARGEKITTLAPFMSENTVNEIATKRMKEGRSFLTLAPFMSDETIDSLALQMEEQGESITALAPYLSEEALETIVLSRIKVGRKIRGFLPFVSESLLNRLMGITSE